MIRLKNADDDKTTMRVTRMMKEELGIKEIFKNKTNRLASADYCCLILDDQEEVGFFSLVEEKLNKEFYFLDMGIKEKYQRQGIGAEVKQRILNLDCIGRFIIVETKEDNAKAIGSMENKNIGIRLFEKKGRVFYLLQKDKIEEFIEKDGMQKLAEHIDKEKKEILRVVHEEKTRR